MSSPNQRVYEKQFAALERSSKRLDNATTLIDEVAQSVKLGAELIGVLNAKLSSVETEMLDAFRALAAAATKSG